MIHHAADWQLSWATKHQVPKYFLRSSLLQRTTFSSASLATNLHGASQTLKYSYILPLLRWPPSIGTRRSCLLVWSLMQFWHVLQYIFSLCKLSSRRTSQSSRLRCAPTNSSTQHARTVHNTFRLSENNLRAKVGFCGDLRHVRVTIVHSSPIRSFPRCLGYPFMHSFSYFEIL